MPGDLDPLPHPVRMVSGHRSPTRAARAARARRRRFACAALTMALVAAAVPRVANASDSLVDEYVGLGERMGDRSTVPRVMPRPLAFPTRGPAAGFPLRGPTEVRVVRGGVLIVAESMTGRVLRVGTNGRVSVLPGRKADEFEVCGGTRSGGIVAAPFVNQVVRVRRTAPPTTIAGTGRTGFAGDGGPATAARLNGPDLRDPGTRRRHPGRRPGQQPRAPHRPGRHHHHDRRQRRGTVLGGGRPGDRRRHGPPGDRGAPGRRGARDGSPQRPRPPDPPGRHPLDLRRHRDRRVRRRRRAGARGAPHDALGDRPRRRRQRGGVRLRQPDRPADLSAGRDHHRPRRAAAAGRRTVSRADGLGPGPAPGVPLGQPAARRDELR